MLDRLWRFLEDHDLPADAAVRAGFEHYVALLERANRAMNLIGPMSSEALVTTLICDSLVPLTLGVPLPGPLLDLGSGAGLPGIPLALAAPALEVHLVEPRERRYRFLGQAIRALGRPGLQRHQGRIDRPGEQRALGLPEHLGTAVAKAVLPIAEWLELASGLVAPDTGRIVAMCSARDWDDTGVPVASALGLSVLVAREVVWAGAAPRVCAVLRVS